MAGPDVPAPSGRPGPGLAGDDPVLSVEDLRVHFRTAAGPATAVDGVSWSLGAGETLAVVGESGSGKTVSALAVMGLLPPPPGCRTSGRIMLRERDLLRCRREELRRMRGRDIAMIFQDPATALNPVLTVGAQIAEVMRTHKHTGRAPARRRAVELLGDVGIPDPGRRAEDYPHQLSGGMQQRAMIAMALALDPIVLLADEPTTAVDVTVQAQILDLLTRVQAERGTAIVLITHDLALAASQAHRVLVMYAGRVAEVGAADDVVHRPRHAYTWNLLSALSHLAPRGSRLQPIPGNPPSVIARPSGCPFHPRCRFSTDVCVEHLPSLLPQGGAAHLAACHHSGDLGPSGPLSGDLGPSGPLSGDLGPPASTAAGAGPSEEAKPAPAPAPSPENGDLLEVEDLVVHYPVTTGAVLKRRIGEVRAVDGISFGVAPGETLALVGESGSGKSTTARAVLRLIEPTSGTVRFDGEDLAGVGPARLRALRRGMQIVFQDPYASLDPRMSVGAALREPFTIHDVDAGSRVEDLLEVVGLGAEHAGRYPHELSSGQRQRVGIARAIALNPKLVICDEPVSVLDVSLQAQILALLEDLQRTLDLAFLLIAHDLGVVRHVAHRVAVMYLGVIVETAGGDRLFDRPCHPYTQALLSAVPRPDPSRSPARARVVLSGEQPSSLEPPRGCRFHTRCPRFATELSETERQRCVEEIPALVERGEENMVACHYAGVSWASAPGNAGPSPGPHAGPTMNRDG